MPEKKSYDVIVIGAGPAGYIAAIKAGRLGADVLVCESDQVGGTCLNRGCIPTKYYAQSAHTILEIPHAASRGIMIGSPEVSVDMKKARTGKNRTVKRLTAGVRSLLKDASVTVEYQRARVVGDTQVQLGDGQTVTAKSIIVASGSVPSGIPVEGADSRFVVDSTALLDIDYVPRRLAVIGGGVIGTEFASIFRAFGSEVSMIEAEKSLLPYFDADAAAVIDKAFRKRGIAIHTGTQVRSITEKQEGAVVDLSDGQEIEADLVLMAVGRRARLSAVDQSLFKIDKGSIVVDDYGMSSMPGVYAPGDVNGRILLAHAAYQMGETAAHNACIDAGILEGEKKRFSLRNVPSVVYSFPEAARVGLSEQEADSSYDTVTGSFPLIANGRALSAGETEGFVKVTADRRYGQILGVTCVGMHASETINEAALAMSYELTVHEISEAVHGHPTVSEALKEAAAACIGTCYHMVSS
jgi:dihydrolipoamide dehydrogenase